MTKELERFYQEVMENKEINEAYMKLGEDISESTSMEEKYKIVVQFSKKFGYEFTQDDLEKDCKEEPAKPPSDGPYACACVFGGGGPGEDFVPKHHCCATCACVLGGIGMYYNEGSRCHCPLVGGGVE